MSVTNGCFIVQAGDRVRRTADNFEASAWLTCLCCKFIEHVADRTGETDSRTRSIEKTERLRIARVHDQRSGIARVSEIIAADRYLIGINLAKIIGRLGT